MEPFMAGLISNTFNVLKWDCDYKSDPEKYTLVQLINL